MHFQVDAERGELMFVWSSFRSRRRTSLRTIGRPPKALAGSTRDIGDRPKRPLRFLQRNPIKGWNHDVDFVQKAFEHACRRAMLSGLDRGIPPVAHQVGCTVERYRFAFRFGTRTMPLSGAYGGQGKAAGSSDLPAALLSVQTGR
jgi:hypothetical protein